MNRVVIINLNGNAYHLEETGYEALRTYLDVADKRLRDDPDRAEILSDLEQAIAEKCARYLGPGKTVVTASEVERIIADMGPVNPDAAADDAAQPASREKAQEAPAAPAGAPKRLYKIPRGAMFRGVCNGLAAYFGLDVTLVRVLFVILTLLTGGMWILAYLLMMFVMPTACTAEERASAHGQPFNAQELVDRAKKEYAEFRAHDWKRDWRRHKREWRRWQRDWQQYWVQPPTGQPSNASYATRVLAGFLVPIFAIIGAALFVVWLISLVSLATTGMLIGWHLPPGIPLWTAIVALVLIYAIVIAPLRAASRASYRHSAGMHYGWFALGESVVWLGFTVLFFWFAYQFIPGVSDFVDALPHTWKHVEQTSTQVVHEIRALFAG